MGNKYSKDLIFKAIGFIRAANLELGGLGEERVYAMLDAFDPSLKRHVLMELLMGSDSDEIRIQRTSGPKEKIQAVKVIRSYTKLGLREAKDAIDVADTGSVGRIHGDFGRELRHALAQDLVGTGYELI